MATTVELILQFLGVTALTILAERYLSDKAAIGVLVFCLVGLGWKHRNWLNEVRHEHRVVVVSLCVLIFAFCGLAVGLWVTKQTPASGKDTVGRNDPARLPSSGPLQVHAEGTVTDPSKGLSVKGTGTITPSSTDRATSSTRRTGKHKGTSNAKVSPGIIIEGPNPRLKNVRVENGTLEVKPSAKNPRLEGVTVDNKPPVSITQGPGSIAQVGGTGNTASQTDVHETLVSGKLAAGWTLHKRDDGLSLYPIMNTDELDDVVKHSIESGDVPLTGANLAAAKLVFESIKPYVPEPELVETPVGTISDQVIVEHIARTGNKPTGLVQWNYEIMRHGSGIALKSPPVKQVEINQLSSESRLAIAELDRLARQLVNRRYADAILKVSPKQQ